MCATLAFGLGFLTMERLVCRIISMALDGWHWTIRHGKREDGCKWVSMLCKVTERNAMLCYGTVWNAMAWDGRYSMIRNSGYSAATRRVQRAKTA